MHTRDAAPHLYYLFYRSPAPFDRLPVHDYDVRDVPPIDRGSARRRTRRAAASTARVEQQRDHAEPRRPSRRARASRAELTTPTRGASRIGQVAAVDGASRIAHVPRRHAGRGLGLLRLRPDGGDRLPHAARRASRSSTRACGSLARAVADLALHSGALTLDETAALYRERAQHDADAAARARR